MLDGTFDPALFGPWPPRRDYGAGTAAIDVGETMRLILDRKAAEGPAGAELLDMLNGMTRELREQMQMFQMLRRQADQRALDDDADIDRKTAQADAKAAIEAMSLIVRTLEKIDSLQRTLMEDRERAEEASLDDAAYQALLRRIDRLVDARAAERSAERVAAAHAAAVPPVCPGDPGG